MPEHEIRLVAQAAAEGRLYSRAQSQAVALGYAVVTLLAIVLSVLNGTSSNLSRAAS